MARFRSRLALRPINRIKHVVDRQGGMVVATQSLLDIILATDTPTLANTEQVETGSTVNAIYLVVEAYATSSAALSNIYMIVAKNPGGNVTFPNANAVGGDDNKRFVIHQEMKMLEKEPTADSLGGNPRTIFNGVISIPRGYRRFAPNDKLIIQLFAPGVTAEFCWQAHYKEFR